MAYSVLDDIKKRLASAIIAQLTDDADETNGTVINTGRVTEAIDLGDALINSYLRGKHEVPLTTVPDLIRDLSVTVAIRNLYKRRINLSIPETLQIDYKDALRQLGLIRDNKLIIDDAGSKANTAGYYKNSKTSDSRIFTQNDTESGVLDQYFSRSRITPC